MNENNQYVEMKGTYLYGSDDRTVTVCWDQEERAGKLGKTETIPQDVAHELSGLQLALQSRFRVLVRFETDKYGYKVSKEFREVQGVS